jgi:cytochrome c biogenesis protein ResB
VRGKGVLRKVWGFLTRRDINALLILVLLLIVALGSIFPKSSTDIYGGDQELWRQQLQERYAGFTQTLFTLGVFDYFNTPFIRAFILLLGGLTLVCTLDRWRITWRRAFQPQVACPEETIFDIALHRARFTSGEQDNLSELVVQALEKRGYRLQAATSQSQGIQYLRGDRNRLAYTGTLFTHVSVLLLLVGVIVSNVFGWNERVTVGPEAATALEHHPEITIESQDFRIERHPDGSAASYQASLSISAPGKQSISTISVNNPRDFAGVDFYLMGYSRSEPDNQTTLELLAKYDPGFYLVVISGLLLLLGMCLSFYFPPSCVHARIEGEQLLSLAGQANRRAYDFGVEFDHLVEELARKLSLQGLEDQEEAC